MPEINKIFSNIVKSQYDIVECLKSVETLCVNINDYLEDLDINKCISDKDLWMMQDKLVEVRKKLKESFNLQEGTDLRIQKLINLVKVE